MGRVHGRVPADVGAPAADCSARSRRPDSERPRTRRPHRGHMSGRVLALFACLVVSAGVIARADRAEIVPPRQTLEHLPLSIGEWKGVQQEPFTKDILAILGVDDYLTRAYFTPAREGVGVYIGYYESQRQGDTMHSPQNCLPGAGWEPVSNATLDLVVPERRRQAGQQNISINRYMIQKGAGSPAGALLVPGPRTCRRQRILGQVLSDRRRLPPESHRRCAGPGDRARGVRTSRAKPPRRRLRSSS